MPNVLQLLIDRIDTPIGELLLVADDAGKLRALDWADYEERMLRLLRLHYGKDGFKLEPAHNPHGLRDTINRYFAGDVEAIDEIPVQTAGTAFQRSVWKELRNIPERLRDFLWKACRANRSPQGCESRWSREWLQSDWDRRAVSSGHRSRTDRSPATAEVWNASGGCWSTSEMLAKKTPTY